MKTLNIILASAIAAFTFGTLKAQNPAQIVKVHVTYNSNMPSQQFAPLSFIFADGQSDSLSFPDAGNEGTIGQYGDQVFPFSLSADSFVIAQLDARTELTGYRAIEMGFISKNSAEIKITAETFNTSGDPINNATGFIWLEQISTGEKHAILGDTAKFDILANTNFASDFILHVGTACTPIAVEETCYNSNNASIYIPSPNYNNYNLELYKNNILLINTVVAGTDTTIGNLGSGNYVSVVRINGIAVDSSTITINPHTPLVADFIADYNTITQYGTVNFTDYSVGGTTYSWNFGDGDSSTTIGNESHIFDSVGVFTVNLEVSDANGCVSSISDFITVDASPSMQNPNSIAFGHGNSNSGGSSSSGVEEANNSTLRNSNNTNVFASNGHININQKEAVIAQVNISSVNGALVYSGNQNETNAEYAVPAAGVYVVTVLYTDGTSKSWNIAAL